MGSKSQENKLLTQQIERLKQRTEKLKTKIEKEKNINKRTETDGEKENDDKERNEEEEREERRMNKLNIEMRFLRNEIIEEEEGEEEREEIYKTVTSRDDLIDHVEIEENNKEKREWKEGNIRFFCFNGLSF